MGRRVKWILWIILCTLAWTGTVLLMLASWDSYQNNAISFVVKTEYHDWNTSFPSVTVCEQDNRKRVAILAKKYFGEQHNPLMDQLLNEVVYFPSENNYIRFFCGFHGKKARINCTLGSLTALSREVRSPCEEVLVHCYWVDTPFDCCKHFLQMETEFGVCYTINNIHTQAVEQPLYMTSNWNTGPDFLRLEFAVPVLIIVHGPEEVPTTNLPKEDQFQLKPGQQISRLYAVKEMDNDQEVRRTDMERRRCRYPDENTIEMYDLYSYYGCILECKKKVQIELCNCTNFLMPRLKEAEACDLRGAYCLLQNHGGKKGFTPVEGGRKSLSCDCHVTCMEMTLRVIHEDKDKFVEDGNIVSTATIKLSYLPSERDHRYVVRSTLDFIGNIIN